jgi:hypothetical protein
MYLNRRIAKALPAVVNGKVEEEIFFGTVDKIVEKEKNRGSTHWRASYDDDDFDDIFSENDVQKALELYSLHRDKDPFTNQKKSRTATTNGKDSRTYQNREDLESSRKPQRILPIKSSDNTESVSPARVRLKIRCFKNVRKARKGFSICIILLSLSVGVIRNISSVRQVRSEMTKRWDSARKSLYVPIGSTARDNILLRDDYSSNKKSFSSCILWMDDNHRLTEWIAYHYFALPLRHVVIAVDPHSATQPKIHKHWYSLMNITIWNDTDFVTKDLARSQADKKDDLKNKHRARQGQFYQACSRHLKNLNRTYTTYHDTDEFLTISDEFYSTESTKTVHASVSFKSQPGHILQLLEDYHRESHNQTETHQDLSDICIHAPRALYSTVESTKDERQRDVPDWVNSEQFDTIRYRYRLTKRGNHNGLGKAIIDVSRLTEEDIQIGGSTHRPLKSVCNRGHTTFRNYGAIPVSIGASHDLLMFCLFVFFLRSLLILAWYPPLSWKLGIVLLSR